MAEAVQPRPLLLTGATGYIGSFLAERLAAKGWRVHAAVRRPGPRMAHVSYHKLGTDADLEGQLRTIIAETDPWGVVHVAGVSRSPGQSGSVVDLLQGNVVLLGALLGAMTSTGVRRLVNTGSFSQTNGGHEVSPNSMYAASKQAAECLIEFSCQREGLHAITLRLPHVYGPRDRRPKLLNLLLASRRSDTPLLLSPCEQLVDFVFIEDICDAYEVALERLSIDGPAGHQVFGLTSGEIRPLRDIVGLLEKVLGSKLNARIGAVPYRDGETMVMHPPRNPLPGWKAKTTLEQGIRAILAGPNLGKPPFRP